MNGVIRKGLFKSEDWLAVWLGFFIITAVLVGIRPQMPAFKWMTSTEFGAAVTESRGLADGLIRDAELKGIEPLIAPARELRAALDKGERGAIHTAAKKLSESVKAVRDPAVKKNGEKLSRKLTGATGASLSSVFSKGNILRSIYLGLAFLVIAAVGIALMGGPMIPFIAGFPLVYVIAWLSQFIAGNSTINYLGFEYVIFALLMGLFISNVIGVPAWLMEAVKTEYYIKTGLVILGSGILFSEILQAGAIGIVQALSVVFVIWYACFWLAKRLGVEDDLGAILASAVSICGVSAAITACGAINGDKKKLSYAVSLVLIVAVPMMVLEPWIAKLFHIPDIVAGAWLGGTLDTTGSVVAAGAFISEAAMKVGTIVKFSQNVLIGVAAFLLSLWWTFRKGAQTGEKPGVRVIWERFPKFVLGFLIASFAFSFFIDAAVVNETKGILGGIRTIWFALAFTSIGLETRFSDILKLGQGRPAIAFVGAQVFNVFWTLALAYLLFGGFIFPTPMIK